MKPINISILRIARRAEQNDLKHLVDSFVDIGTVFHSLETRDHQVIYGRRGTGKTHILSYLAAEKEKQRVPVIMLDMRTIGSSGGIYSDDSLPLSNRATRLLVDTLMAVQDGILRLASIGDEPIVDLGKCGAALNSFMEAAGTVVVDEVREVETTDSATEKAQSSIGLGVELKPSSLPGVKVEGKLSGEESASAQTRIKVSGAPRLRVNFGSVQRELRRLVELLPGKKLWIVLDEWSEVPLSLQPFLADLIRRTVFPVQGTTVKIAAIRQRTRFRISNHDGGYTGFEVGADVSASIDLDESLVFDNNPSAALEFFRTMLWKHIDTLDEKPAALPAMEAPVDFVRETFTQVTSLEELVRASEGIPRDAINILGSAATRANDTPISVLDIRAAAQAWYQQNKHSAIASMPKAEKLLSWIVDNVIKGKKARAFLLSTDARDDLIDFLYDARAIHLIKQGSSAKDLPGQRFNVYSLDYGLYVDLINTVNAPKGLLALGDESDGDTSYVDVPQTDFRSIRRSILSLEAFYAAYGGDSAASKSNS
ncbi:MAG: hypothetical protein PW999_16660 [Paraburkholderia tropica]|nr:hypothetical protein [Paraburkholderia tropica]